MQLSAVTSFSIADILDPVKFTGNSTSGATSIKNFYAQPKYGEWA